MMADAIPFKKLTQKARIGHPSAKDRVLIFQELLDLAAAAEMDPGCVGFALICLMDNGARRSTWNTVKIAAPQLAKQVRREAALIAKYIQTSDAWEVD
jgi:hypothetical protein